MQTLKESILKNIGIGSEVTLGEWCDSVGIKNYEIVNSKINVNGNVDLRFVEKFPYPFGEITGDFVVRGDHDPLFINWPEKIGGMLKIENNAELTNLDNIPLYNLNEFRLYSCKNITSLIGLDNLTILGGLQFSSLPGLKSLAGCPDQVPDFFSCEHCRNLKNLEGAPKKVGGSFYVSSCDIKSLKGSPKEVGEGVYISFCNGLEDLAFFPRKIGKNIEIKYLENIKTIDNLPTVAKCDLHLIKLPKLKSLISPKTVRGSFYFQKNGKNQRLKSNMQFPQKVGGNVYRGESAFTKEEMSSLIGKIGGKVK